MIDDFITAYLLIGLVFTVASMIADRQFWLPFTLVAVWPFVVALFAWVFYIKNIKSDKGIK